MSDFQVIRTPEELEALDPDTVLIDSYGEEVRAAREAMEEDHGK